MSVPALGLVKECTWKIPLNCIVASEVHNPRGCCAVTCSSVHGIYWTQAREKGCVASRETASYCERSIVNDKTELFMS